jgi:hypothetical protein
MIYLVRYVYGLFNLLFIFLKNKILKTQPFLFLFLLKKKILFPIVERKLYN